MEKNLFETQSIAKNYFRLSLPLMCSMLVTLIYNLADTFFVAQTGVTELVAGVSLGLPVITLMMAAGNVFGQGGSSLISRLLGQQKRDDVERVSSFCFWCMLLVGVVSAVLMLLFRVPILYLLGASENTFSYALDYYTWLAVGTPVIMLNFIHSNLLRSEGLSKESMAGTVFGTLVNIVLDPIMISGFGWGAAGAAIATVIGYLCTDVLFVIIVLRKSRVLSIDPRKAAIPAAFLVQIFGIGIPAAIVNVMQSASVALTNQFLLPYGDEKIAAMGIVLKVNMIAQLLLTGFAFGGQPMFGYYYGSGDKKRLSEVLRFSLRFISGVALVLTAVIFAAAPLLMRCFMTDAGILQDGTVMLRWQVSTSLFVGIVLLMTVMCQSMGKVAASFVLSVSRQGVIFLAVLLIAYHAAGYQGIIAAQAIADGLTAIVALVLCRTRLYQEFQEEPLSGGAAAESSLAG